MKIKHTPGPWRVLPSMSGPALFVWTERERTRDDRGGYTERCVAKVMPTSPPAPRTAQDVLDEPYNITGEAALANATLIAAAPDLLAALAMLMDDSQVRNALTHEQMSAARAAIAKAEGRA